MRLSPLIEHGQLSIAVEPATQVKQLRRSLKLHRPHVLHLVCHTTSRPDEGEEGPGKFALALEDNRGKRDAVTANDLVEVLRDTPTIRLVVLEACRSAAIADEVATMLPNVVVVGTRQLIVPRSSTRFFLSFHESLAAGQTIQSAFDDAQRDMELLAPSMRGIPVLFGSPTDKALTGPPPIVSYHINPNHYEDYVAIAKSLLGGGSVIGREDELARLDALWFGDEDPAGSRPTANIVHIRGGAGIGKTALLARWLDMHAARGYCGATRVLAWSFDPLSDGLWAGDEAEFFDRAFDFFGAVSPYIREGAGEAPYEGLWLAGLRLARLIRHERVLLCLDAVPTRSRGSVEAANVYGMFDPGIAALLHELSKGHAGLCVVTTRSHDSPPLFGDNVIEVGGLESELAAEVLKGRRVFEPWISTLRRGQRWGHQPLGLSLVAAALRRGVELPVAAAEMPDGDVPGPLDAVGALDDPVARKFLECLAVAGGTMGPQELHLVFPEPNATSVEDVEGEERPVFKAVRYLRQRGVVRVCADGSVRLTHAALLAHIRPKPRKNSRFVDARLETMARAASTTTDPTVFARAIRVALGFGAGDRALRAYREHICRISTQKFHTNHLSRTAGFVAGAVEVLAEFFEPDPTLGLGLVLRPSVDASPPDRGLLHYHAGRALRHLGQMKSAQAHLHAAIEAYDSIDERVAICANDLAEALIWRGDLDGALKWAEVAVDRANKAAHLVPKPSSNPLKKPSQAWVRAVTADFVCHATLGYVHLRRREYELADKNFQHAKVAVQRRNQNNAKWMQHLFSRPGYYYWAFLRDRLERHDSSHPAESTLKELASLIVLGHQWHQLDKIAGVSRAFDALTKGQTLLICARNELKYPEAPVDGLQPLTTALYSISYAIHIFRAHEHLWMLPSALNARAGVHTELGDHGNAKRDRAEARELESMWGETTMRGDTPQSVE